MSRAHLARTPIGSRVENCDPGSWIPLVPPMYQSVAVGLRRRADFTQRLGYLPYAGAYPMSDTILRLAVSKSAVISIYTVIQPQKLVLSSTAGSWKWEAGYTWQPSTTRSGGSNYRAER